MERSEVSHAQNQAGPWYKRMFWLIAIWLASVAALGIVASGIRGIMHMAGMSSR
ncbi:DUF2474 domain-containing protein [Pseudomonas carnis]|uniref:DUF2474 domain-containing protein n=1 Tax=Pseudomonas carnis TaxID=2487355 RepID=UPI0018E65F61|nr:DUF2474 domain-containing protein [Pseudomonas carnis]MBI6658180.1 DUF2474 domain-containing protein [Pseudomonas carnis]MBI6662798.1 DUF2474 domain-containing protein [Pseudomonas carnis]MBI6689746.1 DUF2474 domain-containing protein [Pseudomonas carnis]